MSKREALPRPPWLRVQIQDSPEYNEVRELTERLNLNTVCAEARCPNIHECWGKDRTATFMVLGDICTRRCMFCNVAKGVPRTVDPEEPRNVARAVQALGLRHAVITQVNRDDLPDGGAAHFAETIRSIHELHPECRTEVLISDLQGNWDALETILDAEPTVVAHNLECVPRLYKRVRPYADYRQSCELLERAAAAKGKRIKATKAGVMVGLGETEEEMVELMHDMRRSSVDLFTVGQYLRPSPRHLAIEHYYTPEQFARLKQAADDAGFVHTEAGPLVRSSYHAARATEALERLLEQ